MRPQALHPQITGDALDAMGVRLDRREPVWNQPVSLGTAAMFSAQTPTRSPRDTRDRIQRAAPHANHDTPKIEGA